MVIASLLDFNSGLDVGAAVATEGSSGVAHGASL